MIDIGSAKQWVEFLASQNKHALAGRIETPSAFALRTGKQYPLKFRKVDRAEAVPKQCFMNAFRLAAAHGSELLYVEGWACHAEVPIATEHAWCWDGESIIDPTWDNRGIDYFGTEFDSVLVMRIALLTEVYGILGSWHKWPAIWHLLKDHYPIGEEDDARRDVRAVQQA